jgi:hypothetical protein
MDFFMNQSSLTSLRLPHTKVPVAYFAGAIFCRATSDISSAFTLLTSSRLESVLVVETGQFIGQRQTQDLIQRLLQLLNHMRRYSMQRE